MNVGYKKISQCRISGSKNIVTVLDLGQQALTGVFPQNAQEQVTVGPLELVWCPESSLVQLAHSYEASEMYGDNYGYRSGLNQSMVDHLSQKVMQLERVSALSAGDVVLDIGSNDSTLLRAYSVAGLHRIGIDPTANKFREYYPPEVSVVADFFSANNFAKVTSQKAKIVTSIAMFYDLEDPVDFARQIATVLADDGIWHFEQSYLPAMLRTCSYDTICHEHVEYYSLHTVQKILVAAGLELVDVQMNAVNGGSFAVTACKSTRKSRKNTAVIDWLLEQETRMGLHTLKPYEAFRERVLQHRFDLKRLLEALVSDKKTIVGYGASTKGNVLLQFCGIGRQHLAAIAEVNPDKFGRVTPGTHIPIISEAEAKAMKPDYMLVLPWHFKDNILRREQAYLRDGGKLIFPLPEIEII